jgi:methylated-DNA-[protein]-cysteine S-methyltransferase
MAKMNKNNQHDLSEAVWLRDHEGEESKDKLLAGLDELYEAGPGPFATEAALVQLSERLKGEEARVIYFDILENTPVGSIAFALNDSGVMAVNFDENERTFLARLADEFEGVMIRSEEKTAEVKRQLENYFSGDTTGFNLPLSLEHLTEFQRKVLLATLDIRMGQVATYGEIARRIGRSRAARAVGQALARNPIPILIPCHRVLASDGSLHGYSGKGGIKTKRQLLVHEGALPF